MNQWLSGVTHVGWNVHDLYWLGACFFIVHFIQMNPAFLRRKNILFSLLVMTAFWPLAYTFSIIHIMRFRRLKQ